MAPERLAFADVTNTLPADVARTPAKSAKSAGSRSTRGPETAAPSTSARRGRVSPEDTPCPFSASSAEAPGTWSAARSASAERAKAGAVEAELLAACAAQLHGLWLRYAAESGDRAPFLLEHFNSLGREVLLAPPPTPPPPLPAPSIFGSLEARQLEAQFGGAAVDRRPSATAGGPAGPIAGSSPSAAVREAAPRVALTPPVERCSGASMLWDEEPARLYPEGSSGGSSVAGCEEEEEEEGPGQLEHQLELQQALLERELLQRELCERELEELAQLPKDGCSSGSCRPWSLEVGKTCEDGEEASDDELSERDCERLQRELFEHELEARLADFDDPIGGWPGLTPSSTPLLEGTSRSPTEGPSSAGPQAAGALATPRRGAGRQRGTAWGPRSARRQSLLLRALGGGAAEPSPPWSASGCRAGEPHVGIEDVARDLEVSLLQAGHVVSERQRPDAEAVLAGISPTEREQTMAWLMQACHTLFFREAVLFGAAHLFDRYSATLREPMPREELHVLILAVVSTSLKMHGTIELEPPLPEVVSHLGRRQVPPEAVFRKEREVLQALAFEVSTPPVAELLEALLVRRLRPNPPGAAAGLAADRPELAAVRSLSSFVLQLSLLEVGLHHRFPHTVLAAGAIYVALWHCQAGPEEARALLRDVVVACQCGGGEHADSPGSGSQAGRPPAREVRARAPWAGVIQEIPDHGEPAARIHPEEAERVVHEQWATALERRLAGAPEEAVGKEEPREAKCLDVRSQPSAAVLTLTRSPAAATLPDRGPGGIDASPPRADGAPTRVEADDTVVHEALRCALIGTVQRED